MPQTHFTGVVRVGGRGAWLQSPRLLLQLVPYPQDVRIPKLTRQHVGVLLFGYLEGREATMVGQLVGKTLYNAHNAEPAWRRLVGKRAPATDPRIDALHDRSEFSAQIREFFGRKGSHVAERLTAAGILTISAFYHRIKNFKPEAKVFARYLEVPLDTIESFLQAMEGDRQHRALVASPPRMPVTHGINLGALALAAAAPLKHGAPRIPAAFPARERTPTLPRAVDLTRFVTKVKDQSQRGTCVAYTACSMLEAALVMSGAQRRRFDLSEQYLYWGCKEIDGSPKEEGTLLEYAATVLRKGIRPHKAGPGVCKENDWPYARVSISGNQGQGPPPVRAATAARFAARTTRRLRARSIKALKAALAAQRCVGLSVYTYHFWTDGYAWREGVISLPLGIKPDGAHAVCLVGYQDNDATHQDGYFIFKNSWGPN